MSKQVLVKFKGPFTPEYKTSGSAGFDIVANENVVIPAKATKAVKTGLFLEIPPGYEGQVRSRSGLAANSAVFVLNSPGTIDSDYRGEIIVILANMQWTQDHHVKKGDRIAQMVISPCIQVAFEDTEKEQMTATERGEKGLGSTGR
jgi:dUTP pyrophosphatase